MNNSIYPCLWFDGKAYEAADFYINLFPNSKLSSSNPMVSIFELNGTKFMGLNGGPMYQISPSISFYVYCEAEQEIEHLYTELSEKGKINMPLGKYDWSKKYAWVVDQFGVNW